MKLVYGNEVIDFKFQNSIAALAVLGLTVFGFAVYLFYEHRRFDHLPGPQRSNFWFGNAKDISTFRRKEGKTFYDYFLAQAIKHGNVFVVFIFHKAILFISEPTVIRELLLRHHLLLPKDPKVYRKLGFVCGQSIAGHGLVTNTDEASWKPRRRCLKHVFRRENIGTYFINTFNDCAQVFLKSLLEDKADGVTKVFMVEEFTRVSLLASDQAICGKDSKLTEENFDEILHAFEKCLEAVQWNLTSVLPHSVRRLFTGKTSRQREFIKAAKTVRCFAQDAIETRERKLRETRQGCTDILAYILNITKNDPNFTMEEKIDEVVTFFVAAHETTAGCLAFTLYEILSNENIYQRVLQEIDLVIGTKTFITQQDLNKLHFLHNCIKESLRLYPVVGGPDRILLEDLVVRDYYLPGGCSVFVEKYVAHRNPKYWKNPEIFDPYRFNKRQSKKITPGVYFPFSLGPRNCIGKTFAEVQIKLVLVRLFQQFQLELVPGQSQRIKERLTLRPRDGVVCTMKRRQFPKRKLCRAMTLG